MQTKILLTGGLGFSGSHLVDRIVDEYPDWELIVLDCLSYAASLDNVARHLDNPRFKWIRHDISLPLTDEILRECDGATYLCNLAAETHVSNSLKNPEPFMYSNFIGTWNLLEAARKLCPAIFLQVSTDEVYGASLSSGTPYKEDSPLCPSNPYSASKAAAEQIVMAYSKSYNLNCAVSRSSNLYGPRQNSEKYIPNTIAKLRSGQTVEIHTGANGEIGSRQYLSVFEQSTALLFLLRSEAVGVYNIAGERRTNLEIVRAISERLGCQKKCSVKFVNAFEQYKSHDLHYSIDDSKIRSLPNGGWSPKLTFEEGLALTV